MKIKINDEIIKINFELYKARLEKHSIISKKFETRDFSQFRMHFGDGDCSFA